MASSPFSQLSNHCRQAIEDIYHGCEEDGERPGELASLPDHDFALVQLLRRQASILRSLYPRLDPAPWPNEETYAGPKVLLRKRLEDILSISYSKFYHYMFGDLPLWLRQLYTDASIVKFSDQFLSSSMARCLVGGACVTAAELDNELTDMVKTLDLAIVMSGAAGANRGRTWIDEALSLLQQCCTELPAREELKPTGPGDGKALLSFDLGKDWSSLSSWDEFPSFSTFEPVSIPVSQPIRRSGCLTHESFQNYLHRPAHKATGPHPLVISGLAEDWPARTTRPWCKPAYLLSRTFGGRRLVPVEIGRSYVDQDWGQELITFRDFIRTYVDPSPTSPASPPLPKPPPAPAPRTTSSGPTSSSPPPAAPEKKGPGYLAQHPLLAQIPALRADIAVPDLCYTSPPPNPFHRGPEAAEEVDEPRLNAWLGPAGTVTPPHTDPYHNLLVQVVGRKYVRLYGPWERRRMRPRGTEAGVDMSNTSRWDVGVEEGWDERPADGSVDGEEDENDGEGGDDRADGEEVPFKDIPYVDCILEPGDTLYIPVGWWHYVRSLSVSFSVSFWWN